MGAGSASGGGISNTSSNSYAAVIAVSANLGPIIVWRDEAPGNSDIYVKRWNGSSWVELGSGSASGGGISANSGQSSSPAIVIGADGYPVVAWGDATPGQSEIYVKRWDGSAWVEMGAASASGGGISNTSANSYRPSLCLGPDNLPVVAWQEFISGSNYDIFIRKWNGSAWVEMGTGSASGGGVSNNTGTSELPCLRRGADGNPVVAWDDSSRGNYEVYVRRWDGSAWAAISTGSASSGGVSNNNGVSINTSLAIDGSGRPVVTWQDTLSGMTNIYVRRLESSAWVEMGTGSASGGGISNTSGYAERPCVAIGADGNPVIAWRDTSGGSGGDIYLRRWDGSSWVELPAGSASGTGISANTAGTSLLPFVARDNDGSLIVAWQDTAVGNSEIYVRHYPLPMVTVAATDPNASETGPDTGTFTVARTGDTSSAIVVGYTLSGTASNGVDYISLPGSVTMSAGNTNATVTVTPIDDALVEGNETVILTLAAGSGYTVGSPNSATVTIADNDVVYSPAPTGVDLADASDTGASNTDNITNLDNSSPSKRLTFHVTGTVSGATVKLLWNSTVIGTATASGTTTDVTTNGSTDLPDGLQTITARQTAPGEFESGDSPALAITIDTQVPAISSWVAVNIAAGGGSTQTITVTYSDGGGVSTASLGNNNIRVTGPNGYDTLASFGSVTQNGNTWTAAYTITAPGGTWDHADIGTYTIAAADTQIYDLAGNVVTGATLGTFFVADADWTIIKGAASSAMDSLAADELKKYVEQMTGKTVALITDAETPTGTNVFLVGKAATNTKIADFVSRALIAISPTNPGTEGYINKTVDDGGKHYVVLAGCDDMGAQYSVYNFLESYCKVGFLLDGDTVPHVDPLVVTNLDVSRKPFTKYRIQSVYGKGKLWYGA
ncbi:MAG: Ig-like domain-containing protein, partial [Verrucomicrobia bacterium]|nr:Ig-like domain-containing protein [Verrucomicrobiota bacterium]